ncbi:hypothetical protein BC829DRAFT_382605 [Chytridium lagenaria]|nr:hypothetical protein BC829DRAFT_382605 [Chytridium lagenaria]
MGLICKKASRVEMATRHFQQALSLNPFLWIAFEALCQMYEWKSFKTLDELPQDHNTGWFHSLLYIHRALFLLYWSCSLSNLLFSFIGKSSFLEALMHTLAEN